jgi:hypothetical protein
LAVLILAGSAPLRSGPLLDGALAGALVGALVEPPSSEFEPQPAAARTKTPDNTSVLRRTDI